MLGKADVYSDSLIKQTIETWQSLANRTVTRRDAEEIIANMSGVINLLQSWSEGEVPAGTFADTIPCAHGTPSRDSEGEQP